MAVINRRLEKTACLGSSSFVLYSDDEIREFKMCDGYDVYGGGEEYI
jgi:hypothetical protein